MTKLHKLALAYEHRPGVRTGHAVFYRDGQQVNATTGDWVMSRVLGRLAVQEALAEYAQRKQAA